MFEFVTADRVVPAGLSVHRDPDDGTGLARYSLVHDATGAEVFGPATGRCTVHMDQVVGLVAAARIDWELAAPVEAHNADMWVLYETVRDEVPLCFDPESGRSQPCAGDGRPPVAGAGPVR